MPKILHPVQVTAISDSPEPGTPVVFRGPRYLGKIVAFFRGKKASKTRVKQYHFSIIFETVSFHHLFARCQFYDEHHAEFDQRTTHLKPISKEFCVQLPFQSPWHSQFLWRLMGVLSLRNLKMCWSQTNSEPSTAQQSWGCANRLPRKCSVHSEILEGCSWGCFMVLFPWQ